MFFVSETNFKQKMNPRTGDTFLMWKNLTGTNHDHTKGENNI
jgi:hypothetical protein